MQYGALSSRAALREESQLSDALRAPAVSSPLIYSNRPCRLPLNPGAHSSAAVDVAREHGTSPDPYFTEWPK